MLPPTPVASSNMSDRQSTNGSREAGDLLPTGSQGLSQERIREEKYKLRACPLHGMVLTFSSAAAQISEISPDVSNSMLHDALAIDPIFFEITCLGDDTGMEGTVWRDPLTSDGLDLLEDERRDTPALDSSRDAPAASNRRTGAEVSGLPASVQNGDRQPPTPSTRPQADTDLLRHHNTRLQAVNSLLREEVAEMRMQQARWQNQMTEVRSQLDPLEAPLHELLYHPHSDGGNAGAQTLILASMDLLMEVRKSLMLGDKGKGQG